MSSIDLSTTAGEGFVSLQLVGELDISNAPRVDQELRKIESEAPATVLDLRGLTFMDSTGLRLIVTADARAREEGRRFALIRGPDSVDRVFRITFVDKRLEFVDEPAELTREET
jgi:anti-sigma B factor antagonist